MKKSVLFVLALTSILSLFAQDAFMVWKSSTMSWYGVDFTKAKIMGYDVSPHTIRDEYFKAWNDVIISMDLAKMFEKNAVYKDPNGMIKDDMARETETMNTGEVVPLTEEDIAARVKEMGTGSKKAGLGLVLIVENLDKTSGNMSTWVTFFDIATRKVLWLKKLEGKAGSNIKTAGGNAIKDILSQIDKKEWKAWRKEANY